jgi:hypothetical protein
MSTHGGCQAQFVTSGVLRDRHAAVQLDFEVLQEMDSQRNDFERVEKATHPLRELDQRNRLHPFPVPDLTLTPVDHRTIFPAERAIRPAEDDEWVGEEGLDLGTHEFVFGGGAARVEGRSGAASDVVVEDDSLAEKGKEGLVD